MRIFLPTALAQDAWRRLSNLPQALRHAGWKGTWTHAWRVFGELNERALVGPDLIRISLTDYICNHKCPMCTLQVMDEETRQGLRRTEKQTRMVLEHYRRLFSTMPAGVTDVNLVGGGEPLMHPDSVEIMRLIKQRGLRGSLITNGALLNAETARAMLDMGWDDTRVSVNAGSAEIYRQVNGADNFTVTRENLRFFSDARARLNAPSPCVLRLCFILQRENLGDIDAMYRFTEAVGADSIEWDLIIPLRPEDKLTADERALALSRLDAAAATSRIPSNLGRIRALLSTADKDAVRVAPPETPAAPSVPAPDTGKEAAAHFLADKECIVGFRQVFIRSDGDVVPCCFSDEILGNVKQASFRDVWYGQAYGQFRKRLMAGRFPGYCRNAPEKCWPHVLRETSRARRK